MVKTYSFIIWFCCLSIFFIAPYAHAQQHAVDSAEVLKARYDSLVNHMNKTYVPQQLKPASPAPIVPIKINTAAVQPKTTPPADTAKKVVKTEELKSFTNETKQVEGDPTAPAIEVVEGDPTAPAIKTAVPIDTPKIKVVVPVDTLMEEELGTEDLLVDTNEVEIIEGDEADSEGEAEGEFDPQFTGYSDVSYWDLLRDPNFRFDQTMIPAEGHYPFDWDTVVINPYKVSLKDMNDTVLLKLKDSMDCSFHPPAIGDLTSNFGFRSWGRKAKFHFGVDVRMEVGDPVYAIFDGVVRVAKRSADYGYVVLIRHYNGLETLYAHFDQLLAYTGKPVRSGEIIGLAGSTGRSTGPHLHFEVRFKGEKIDPNKIINFPSGSLMSDSLQIDKTCFSHLYKVQQAKIKSRYYVVRKGDTLGKIAYKNGVSVKQITRLNKISTRTKLKAGRRLRIR